MECLDPVERVRRAACGCGEAEAGAWAEVVASERILRASFEQAPVAMAIMGAAGEYRQVNRRLCELLGYDERELVGLTYREVTHPDHAASDRASHVQLVNGEVDRLVLEKQMVRKDGRRVWHRTSITPIALDGEQVFLAVAEDITAQREAEQGLSASEARLRLFVEHAPAAIALLDNDLRYLAVSRRYSLDYGLGDRDLIGRRHYDVFPEIPQRWREVHARCLAGAVERSDGEPFVRVDGHTDWVRWEIRPWHAADGAIGGLVLSSEILNEQRRMAAALQASEGRFRAMFEHAGLGVAVIEPASGRLLAANPTLCDILGHAVTALTALTWRDVTHPDDDAAAVLAPPEARAATHEQRCVRADGTALWCRVTRSRFDHGGEAVMVTVEDVSERHRAEEALRESERRLATVFRQSLAGMGLIRCADRRLFEVSDSLVRMLGWSRDELLGRDALELAFYVEPGDRDRVQAWPRNTGEPVEIRARRKSGEVGHFLVTIGDLVVAGEPCEVCLLHDITPLRQADAALRASEAHLRTLFDLAPIGIAETDLRTGRMRRVNARLCEITGYSGSELCQLSIVDDLTHPDDRPTSSAVLSGLRAGESIAGGERATGDADLRLEKRYLRKDGSVAWVHVTATVIRDPAGQPVATLAAIEDIGERRRVAAALRDSEARYRALVDSLDDAVFTIDAAGRLGFVNRAVASYGYAPAALVGRSVLELVHPDDQASAAELITGAIDQPRELRILDAHGKVRVVRVTVRPRPAGSAIGLTGVAVDLTARRETEEQLRAAQKMEAVGRLAGGVAHDFNNLLSVILSYTDLAVESLHQADPMRTDLLEVLAAGHRAEGLTRQLLAFSRRQLLEPVSTDLHELVVGLGRMLRRLIGEDVELTIADGEPLPRTTIDRGQIEQVLMNLVVNSRDAMPDGGKVTITTRPLALDGASAHALDLPPGRYVELAVADTGCGMDEAVRVRVFEPFFTTKGVGKGTGLGLSMVYGIVRQSGGAVAVESVPGRGSTFRVYLPVRDEVAPSISGRIAIRRLDSGHETVLVVEDEPALRAVVQRVLSSAGYQVLVASHGQEALRLADEHGGRIQLILTDVIMPSMSGRELVERLAPRCPRAAVIFMSGYTDEAIERYGVLDAEFLRKPFDLRVLTERVRATLDARARA